MRDDDVISLSGLVLEVARGLERGVACVHRAHGLQGNEFSALIRLSRNPGRQMRMSALASQLGVSNSGTTSIVDRLAGRGLVTRDVDPADRRSWVVRLTDDGDDLLRADVADLLPVLREVLVAPLGEDAASFVGVLERVRAEVAPGATAR